jgi:hypothetical protein
VITDFVYSSTLSKPASLSNGKKSVVFHPHDKRNDIWIKQEKTSAVFCHTMEESGSGGKKRSIEQISSENLETNKQDRDITRWSEPELNASSDIDQDGLDGVLLNDAVLGLKNARSGVVEAKTAVTTANTALYDWTSKNPNLGVENEMFVFLKGRVQAGEEELRLAREELRLAIKRAEAYKEKGEHQQVHPATDSKQRTAINVTDLCAAKDIQIKSEEELPIFTAPPQWTESICRIIVERLARNELENKGVRLSPMGLVRFTRGGKSRALREIARYLKKENKDMGVISISMNDDTPLSDEEQNDPLTALCLRIAFAARKDISLQFDAFRKTYYVTKDVIEDWLITSNEPIVLLVDELNLLEGLGAATQPRPDLEEPRTRLDVPKFLKKNFLVGPNRYFIFTSHVSSTSTKLSVYMDSVSGRAVLIKRLPVVTSLLDARIKLDKPKLSAVMAIYCGLSPALLSSVEILAETVPKQVDAINKWIDVNSSTVRTLLQTFLSGDSEGVPPSLSYLVDAADGILNKICWIPFHIVAVLRKVRHYEKDCDKGLLMFCKEIVSEFYMFGEARLETGKAWEHLFYLVLLFRIASREDHDVINWRQYNMSETFTMSCGMDNLPFTGDFRYRYNDCRNPHDLLAAIPTSGITNHIAVYYPPHHVFETYDIFVVMWDGLGTRYVTGYQLKQGSDIKLPNKIDNVNSFLIRGESAGKRYIKDGWTVPSSRQITSFFGESGRNWTPNVWKELREGTSDDNTCSTPSDDDTCNNSSDDDTSP